MIKIGPLEIDMNVFLAPLSGCSDLSFRLISRELGAKFCFFEMVDSNSVHYKRRGAFDLLKTDPDDSPIAGQLLGSDLAFMLEAAGKILNHVDIEFLDVNSACPARKVIKKKSGAYLLKEPKKLSAIIKSLASALPIPVTVKIRTGYDKIDTGHIVDVAKRCEDSGAAAIFVHGRLAVQGYTGEIDYGSIKAIKENVSIPVFGMGNIMDVESAALMFKKTNCDGIGVARGSFGNPWIFNRIDEYLKSGSIVDGPSRAQMCCVLKRHLSYIYKNEDIRASGKIGPMRKVAIWYFKGFSGAASMRERITRARSYEELIRIVDDAGYCS